METKMDTVYNNMSKVFMLPISFLKTSFKQFVKISTLFHALIN